MLNQAPYRTRGFTLIELVMVIVIVGILAIVVLPRLFSSTTFQSRGLADQLQASLRFAQKVAIAQHRFVCADLANVANSNFLTMDVTSNTSTSVVTCASVPALSGYALKVPSGITVTAPAKFSFNALGQPRTLANAAITTAMTVNVVGDITRTITVEAETGYVHQ